MTNVVEFVAPIVGFDEETSYELEQLERTGTLWSLTSTRTPQLRFIVAPPGSFFPDYAPPLDEAAVAPLEAGGAELTVLVILSVSGSIRTATANLLAPLVLAADRHRGMQVILADDTLPVRAPLLVGADN